ncbi:MAG: acetyltransferase [Candidatus Omnitrophica bacterium CG11_big_fil_rev_8_21_14_0_20_45_26]|uniref:Acetyltransferase n=1 Tax=Candidatus Abzuiibacterium crystallinum TaxID=1974748 RepID=A0A2H0LLK7_9BACT|nr:MAG: acetyltransferase [Candidatus Omnitrophica bacterium CG11_big_fil_rev_8_21_14_0_20_45_26]PIW64505.1 MAG: acyltransferase [Candidatus Omnitrophica bacterium CG12_big_fil_rev_8_21_14_0_65_45_16]
MNILQKILSEIQTWFLWFLAFVPGRIGSFLRFCVYGLLLKHCGRALAIEPGCELRGLKQISFGNNVSLGRDSVISAAGRGTEVITFGNHVHLNQSVMINADCSGKIEIGNDVIIGPRVIMRASNHDISKTGKLIREQGHRGGTIVIHNNVWIGAGAILLANVEIGEGAVIAAGAVVTKNVEPFTMVGGVPAAVIGVRKSAQ